MAGWMHGYGCCRYRRVNCTSQRKYLNVPLKLILIWKSLFFLFYVTEMHVIYTLTLMLSFLSLQIPPILQKCSLWPICFIHLYPIAPLWMPLTVYLAHICSHFYILIKSCVHAMSPFAIETLCALPNILHSTNSNYLSTTNI